MHEVVKYTHMASPEQKRTLLEKGMDVTFSGFSVLTLPLWIGAGVTAATIGAWWAVAGAGVMATSDAVTIKETFQEKKSVLNPSYWVDKVRGRNRLGGNQRVA